ncbi:MAG: methionyl-tRNA formyltransferase, partial [Eubacteriales bacterium]
LNPWPGAFTFFRGEQVKIWKSMVVDNSKLDGNGGEKHISDFQVGEIIDILDNGIICLTGKGFIEIQELQPAGKKKMSASAFVNGRRCKVGEIFSV